MAHIISNSGHDERGSYKWGKAGDQTGEEWMLRSWYNRPWTCVLRYPDENVGMLIAELAVEGAQNNHIGYDQEERYTLWDCLKVSGYRPANIKTNCEADCTAGVSACIKAAGYLLNISNLKNVSAYLYSGNMRGALKAAGFKVLTASKYLTSPSYLIAGDILLCEEHHAATNISYGNKVSGTGSTVTDLTPYKNRGGVITTNYDITDGSDRNWLQKGDNGVAVKDMQEMLIAVGYACGASGADGDFGRDTLDAVVKFQTDNGLDVDGEYGEKSKAKLTELYKKKTGATTQPTQQAETKSKPSDNVKAAQKQINLAYRNTITSVLNGNLIEENGVFGDNDKRACVAIFKYIANRQYDANLTILNPNFGDNCKTVATKMVVTKGMTNAITYLVEYMLSGVGYYNDAMDARCGDKLTEAIKKWQKDNGIAESGSFGSDSWYKYFNK